MPRTQVRGYREETVIINDTQLKELAFNWIKAQRREIFPNRTVEGSPCSGWRLSVVNGKIFATFPYGFPSPPEQFEPELLVEKPSEKQLAWVEFAKHFLV